MPRDTDVFKKMASLSLCPFHPDWEVEFKCSYHKNFVCPLCLRDAHRYCSRIEPIDKIKNDRNSYFTEYISKLKSVKDITENLIATSEKNEREVIAQAFYVTAHRYKIVDKLKVLFNFLEKDFHGEFFEIYECEKGKLSVTGAASSSLLNVISEDLNLVETLLKYAQMCKLLFKMISLILT